jgi:hypothetical protein
VTDRRTAAEEALAEAFAAYLATVPQAEGVAVFKKKPTPDLADEWPEPVIIVEAPGQIVALSQHEARAVAAGIVSVLVAPGDSARFP